jgi:hypothetical protein
MMVGFYSEVCQNLLGEAHACDNLSDFAELAAERAVHISERSGKNLVQMLNIFGFTPMEMSRIFGSCVLAYSFASLTVFLTNSKFRNYLVFAFAALGFILGYYMLHQIDPKFLPFVVLLRQVMATSVSILWLRFLKFDNRSPQVLLAGFMAWAAYIPFDFFPRLGDLTSLFLILFFTLTSALGDYLARATTELMNAMRAAPRWSL